MCFAGRREPCADTIASGTFDLRVGVCGEAVKPNPLTLKVRALGYRYISPESRMRTAPKLQVRTGIWQGIDVGVFRADPTRRWPLAVHGTVTGIMIGSAIPGPGSVVS
jgi:hypothetical protein